VADALKKEPDLKVEVIDGARGEFTVALDGKAVAQKGDELPSVDDVRNAVRNAGTTARAGA